MKKLTLTLLIFCCSFNLLAKTLRITVRNLDCPTYRSTRDDFRKLGYWNDGECIPCKEELSFPITLDGVHYKNYKIINDKTYEFNHVGLGHHKEEIALLLAKSYTIPEFKFDLKWYHLLSKEPSYNMPCCDNVRLVWDVEVIELEDYEEEIQILRGTLDILNRRLKIAVKNHDREKAEEYKRTIKDLEKKLEDSEYDQNNPIY